MQEQSAGGGMSSTIRPPRETVQVAPGLRRERWLGYLFVAPMLLFLIGVIFFPLGHAFFTSLHREVGVTVRFVGLDNYARLVEDERFLNSLRVSIVFTVVTVVLHVVIGLPVALFVNRLKRGRTTLRLILLMPWMIAPVMGAIAWVWLLDPNFGVVNHILKSLGLISGYKVWLGRPGSAFASVVVMEVWRGFPFVMLILLAGLQTIPREQYEAVSIDGAGPLQTFYYVVLPHLRYLLVVATTLDVINTIRTFDVIAVSTRGGPVNATEVLPVLIYNTAFQTSKFGPAAAIGMVLLALLLVFSTAYIFLLQPERAGG